MGSVFCDDCDFGVRIGCGDEVFGEFCVIYLVSVVVGEGFRW